MEGDLSKPRHMRSIRVLAAERLAIKEIIDRLMKPTDPVGQRDAAISLANIWEVLSLTFVDIWQLAFGFLF